MIKNIEGKEIISEVVQMLVQAMSNEHKKLANERLKTEEKIIKIDLRFYFLVI